MQVSWKLLLLTTNYKIGRKVSWTKPECIFCPPFWYRVSLRFPLGRSWESSSSSSSSSEGGRAGRFAPSIIPWEPCVLCLEDPFNCQNGNLCLHSLNFKAKYTRDTIPITIQCLATVCRYLQQISRGKCYQVYACVTVQDEEYFCEGINLLKTCSETYLVVTGDGWCPFSVPLCAVVLAGNVKSGGNPNLNLTPGQYATFSANPYNTKPLSMCTT